jgi:GTP-binding protein Era
MLRAAMPKPSRSTAHSRAARTAKKPSAQPARGQWRADKHSKPAKPKPPPTPKREPRAPAAPPPRLRPARGDAGAERVKPQSGRCAILGRPNVGKSTLLNVMLGQKLAIATSKPQTTRTSLLGVCVRRKPPLQIAFVDTPGLHRPASALGRALVESAQGELEHCDVVLLVAPVGKSAELSEVLGDSERELLERLKRSKNAQPVILALNKVDQLKQKHLMLPLLEQLAKVYPFAAVVPISALKGTNIEELILEVGSRLPEGLTYDEEILTDKPEKFFAAELVREALIRNTRQEVPYAAAVVIDTFEDDVKLTRVTATIVVEKDSHKGIVIGRGGQMLKLIGTEARLEMEQMFERKVFLELWVKVLEDWTDDAQRVRELLQADAGAASTER